MATERARNKWGILWHHEADDILELRWLPTTADMGDPGMRASLALFALEAEQVRPKYLLLDGLVESGGKEQIDGPAIFPTAWFSERAHALDWLRG